MLRSPNRIAYQVRTLPELAAELKRVRRERNWSQRDLADAVGVSQVMVCKWEKGTGGFPTVPNCKRLADVLGNGSLDNLLLRLPQ